MDGGIEQNPAYGTARPFPYARNAQRLRRPPPLLRYPNCAGVVAWQPGRHLLEASVGEAQGRGCLARVHEAMDLVGVEGGGTSKAARMHSSAILAVSVAIYRRKSQMAAATP